MRRWQWPWKHVDSDDDIANDDDDDDDDDDEEEEEEDDDDDDDDDNDDDKDNVIMLMLMTTQACPIPTNLCFEKTSDPLLVYSFKHLWKNIVFPSID